MRRFVPLALLAFTLAACASPTPYQPAKKGRNGYEDTAIESDRVRVAFHGNSSTPRTAVETALLFRAAEVTLARGGDYFIVREQDTEKSSDFRTTGTGVGVGAGAFGYGGFHRGVLFGSGFGGSSTTREIPRYSAVAEILVRRGEKPEGDPAAYDANDVLATVGPSLTRPKE